MALPALAPHRSVPWLTLLLLLTGPAAGAELSPAIEFNRDIRPILSDNCFQCHGPDQATREAGLRLDEKAGLFATLEGRPVVVPGQPENSHLLARITSTDPDELMPPPASGRQLTAAQIELLTEWIRQGAKWEQHWSFVATRRPPLPAVQQADWCRNPVDHFILARLEQEGLKPSPEADKATLIRRVTLDLTGLPPTPEEVDAFFADQSPDAYERVVDRLLDSPAYGERMAGRWLDAARYADTSGYQNDGPRVMWRWRDWVINAYNHNLPFDQFTIEQLAGDLLPNPTLDQRIATAFNRNHRGNAEGGIIAEEYAVEYVVDRVDTTATVWLGLTLGCARCHDHKYDPISQREFYQVYAYFNNIPEYGRAIKEGNSPPYITAPTTQQSRELTALQQRLATLTARTDREFSGEMLAEIRQRWEATADRTQPVDWTITDGLLARWKLDGNLRNDFNEQTAAQEEQGEPAFVPGVTDQAAAFDGSRFINAGDVGKFGYFDKFSVTAWVYPQGDGTLISRMTPVPRGDGWYLHLEQGRLQVNLVKRWLDDSIRVETKQPLQRDRWQHVAMTYDGSRQAAGLRVYLDGEPQELVVHYDFLNQTMTSEEPLRLGGGANPFTGRLDDVRLYNRPLEQQEVQIIQTVERIDEILRSQQRTRHQLLKLGVYFFDQQAPAELRRLQVEIQTVQKELAALRESLPTVMVMEELPAPRETFLLERGQYNLPGEKVERGVPAVFPPLPEPAPNNRLGLARWLVDPAHPLTARVAVNGLWLNSFGTGLVATVEDFGSQGTRPTHPELLDWLAPEFIRRGWDVKALQKLIVSSATYRQSSTVTPELLERDPENRLLARGPRFRLTAEAIRDQALAAAGLLRHRLGGPSVRPYQPEGLWNEIATDTKYEQSTGDDLYRRSLYTYWKRTVTPPTLSTFDATARETCSVRQVRTNTPLQALALLNDVTYVEAARALAGRVMQERPGDAAAQLELAFRLTLARRPSPRELTLLTSAHQRYLARYREHETAARELIRAGASPPDPRHAPAELAALTAATSLILNLDETVTRE